MTKPKIIETDISNLTPDPKNARKRTPLSAGVIQRSLEEFGACRSIVIDENDIIRAGNGTVEEAGQLGIERVIVVEASGNEIVAVKRRGLTEEQWKKYAIADNTASDFSTWDADILSEIAQEVDLSSFFPDDKLAEILGELGANSPDFTDKEEDEDELSDLLDKVDEIEPRVKLGEIWSLGDRHRIACGDSTVEKNVRALLGDRFDDVGMIWSDVPYGMKLDADYSKMNGSNSNIEFKQRKNIVGGKTYQKIIGDHDDFDKKLITSICDIFSFVEEQFWWGADYYAEFIESKNEGSWIVWDKRDDNEQFDKMFGSSFELCWSKKKHRREIARIRWCGVFGTEKEFDKKRYHPSQKPTGLCEWVFEKYGQPNDLIFDPFLGSAPSIIAAQKLDRSVFGFELSEAYCTVILDRFINFTGQQPKLVGHLPK